MEQTFQVTLTRFWCLLVWLLKLIWRGLWGINCSSLVRLELQWCQLSLLQYPAYLTNSGDPRYPGVSLRVVIRVLFAEKYVNLVIVRVFLPLHPGRRDERGLWERRTCLPKRFTVYSARGERVMRKAWHVEAKQKIIKLKNVLRVEQFQDKQILNRCNINPSCFSLFMGFFLSLRWCAVTWKY